MNYMDFTGLRHIFGKKRARKYLRNKEPFKINLLRCNLNSGWASANTGAQAAALNHFLQ